MRLQMIPPSWNERNVHGWMLAEIYTTTREHTHTHLQSYNIPARVEFVATPKIKSRNQPGTEFAHNPLIHCYIHAIKTSFQWCSCYFYKTLSSMREQERDTFSGQGKRWRVAVNKSSRGTGWAHCQVFVLITQSNFHWPFWKCSWKKWLSKGCPSA